MSEIIVEVNVENGLPGGAWGFGPRQDARYLLAVVYKLKEHQSHNDPQTMTVTDKFVAKWMDETNCVQLEIPFVDGDHKMFLFVLTRTLESIAKIRVEMDWGAKLLKKMMTQSKIAVPSPPKGQMVL